MIYDLTKIYPEDQFGEYTITHEDQMLAPKWYKELYDRAFKRIPKKRVVLRRPNSIVMDSCEIESLTNLPFWDNARGDILIFGLGLGYIILPILSDLKINSITVVEKDPLIIEHNGEVVKQYDKRGILNIVKGDAFEYESDKKFDLIYIDIYDQVNDETYKTYKGLKERYKKNLLDNGKILCWFEDAYLFIKTINYKAKN